MYLCVTANRALAKSNGYVKDCDVIPANEPAKNLLPFVLLQIDEREREKNVFSSVT